MSVVYKYALPSELTRIDLPADSQFLSVGVQGGCDLVLWALVGASPSRYAWDIHVVCTGEEREYLGTHVGTIPDYRGLVVHVFANFVPRIQGVKR